MRISDWSSDVCSSDLSPVRRAKTRTSGQRGTAMADTHRRSRIQRMAGRPSPLLLGIAANGNDPDNPDRFAQGLRDAGGGLVVNTWWRRAPGHVAPMPEDRGAAPRSKIGRDVWRDRVGP